MQSTWWLTLLVIYIIWNSHLSTLLRTTCPRSPPKESTECSSTLALLRSKLKVCNLNGLTHLSLTELSSRMYQVYQEWRALWSFARSSPKSARCWHQHRNLQQASSKCPSRGSYSKHHHDNISIKAESSLWTEPQAPLIVEDLNVAHVWYIV